MCFDSAVTVFLVAFVVVFAVVGANTLEVERTVVVIVTVVVGVNASEVAGTVAFVTLVTVIGVLLAVVITGFVLPSVVCEV